MSHDSRAGFTIIELLASIAILALLISIVFLTTARFVTATTRDQAMEEIISVLRSAQQKTLARENGYNYGVHIGTDAFTLFRAPAYALGGAGNIVHRLPGNFSFTGISLAGGGSDIIFQPLNGETNTFGTFTLTHADGRVSSVVIRIYASGTAEIE
jgi:prepilin-type N-terminal cleavage/methylation domain-containing protein